MQHLQLCINVGSVLKATREQSEPQVGENSDELEQWNIYKTARFKYKLLINYILQSEVICLVVCTRIQSKSEWNIVKVTARMIND